MNLPKNLIIESKEFNAVIDLVRKQVGELYKRPLHIHYTDHSLSHSDRIIKVVDMLLENATVLNDEERFILVCAILLHDVGMQTPRYADLGELPLSNEALEKIRIKHHEFSYEMILDSVADGKYDFGLKSQSEFLEDIATVAMNHRKLDLNLLEDDVVGNTIIRIQLLSALIRLGDCLDIDYRRVDIDLLQVFPISTESAFFWYCHHYVKGLSVKNQKITITFSFPEKLKTENEVIEAIKKHIKSEIEHQIDEVYDVLDRQGIRLYRTVEFKTQYSKVSTQKMPNSLIEYIKKSNSKEVTYRGVIYGKLNIINRDDLINAYYNSLVGTKTFRNIVSGPFFLSPTWFLERKASQTRHKNFDKALFEFIKENSSTTVNENIKIIFRNTIRFADKIKQFLTPSEYKPYVRDTLQNISEIWGENADKGPLLCCIDPGYMHIITSSDSCAIITHRVGTISPTQQGYLTTDANEILRISGEFDDVFNYNYTSQKQELSKLIEFLNLME